VHALAQLVLNRRSNGVRFRVGARSVQSGSGIGTTVAGYRLESLLGRGGMSVVYLAEQLRLGRKVALKLLAPALAMDDSFRERFEREARRAAEIDHPNIIPIYDAGEADGQLYIAMRYVKGGDLGAAIEHDGPLGLGRTLFVLEQVASALDAAHARELVHRDVKPHNILIEDPAERAFVTDFGIVKRTSTAGVTKTGLFLGTVDYAAPEQLDGRPVDARTDVYALGCVLYECLTGQVPFERENEVAVMHAHLTEQPPLLTSVRPDLPKGLDDVTRTALAKDSDDRFPSCGELIGTARAAAVGSGDTTTVSLPRRRVGRRAARPRRGPWLRWPAAVVAAVLVAAAASGLAVYFLARGDGSSAGGKSAVKPGGTSGLAAVVPADLWEDCTVEETPPAGVLSKATCTPSDSVPARWEVTLYPHSDAAYNAYKAMFEQAGIDSGGACNAVTWRGEAIWRRVAGSEGGLRFCYVTRDEAVIVWTRQRVGQRDANILAVARTPATDQPKLFEWWSTWKRDIGRVLG
jgi:predicted Ser/Thr protein kinase